MRVIYLEDDETLDNGRFLLGTHLMDFQLGDLFFGYAEFMHADIFATDTTEYLPQLLPGLPDPNAAPTCPTCAPCHAPSSGVKTSIFIIVLVVGPIAGAAAAVLYLRRANKRQGSDGNPYYVGLQ